MTCPILMLVGTKDKTGKVRAYNEAWSKKLNQDIVWIPDAAHNSNVDNPTAVNEAITRFIKGLSD
jgi:pimeloyl-ACP methyl ester carboxylesterase